MIAGVGGIALRTLTARYDHLVVKDRLLDPVARRERATVSGPLNYLLVGSDRRAGSPDADQRSDTIMIAHFSAGLDRAYLVSVPRDLLVEIPANTATGYAGGTDKINAAFQIGNGGRDGTQMLSVTLSRLTGVRFDGAAIIDFSGFRQVIDLLGGVEMCVDTEVRSIHTGTVFNSGCREMDGAQALDYARQRYDLPGGDYDRQRHQQQLLRAILDRVTDADLMTKPKKLDQVIRGVGSSLTVDTNGLRTEDLIFALRGLGPDDLSGVQLPSYSETIDDTSYDLLESDANSLFQALRGSDMHAWVATHPKWVNPL
jgi:LCP family protein required for cell wall assembly